MQPTVVVGADWTLHPWHHKSSNVGGVTAGQARHKSSNVGGVTAGQNERIRLRNNTKLSTQINISKNTNS